MNTTIPPFDDVDVRRAVIAGFDREAMRLTFGGEASGDIATHFLPPGIQGFDEAGGLKGPGSTSCHGPAATCDSRPSTSAGRGFASGTLRRRRDVPDGGRERGCRRQCGAGRAAAVREAGFRRSPAPGQHRHDVRQVLRRPERGRGDLPERRLAEGLRRPADVPRARLSTASTSCRAATPTGPSSTIPGSTSGWPTRRCSSTRRTRTGLGGDRQGDHAARRRDPLAVAQQANIRSENVVGTIDEDNGVWSLAHLSLS